MGVGRIFPGAGQGFFQNFSNQSNLIHFSLIARGPNGTSLHHLTQGCSGAGTRGDGVPTLFSDIENDVLEARLCIWWCVCAANLELTL